MVRNLKTILLNYIPFCRVNESARAASLYEAVKTYVGDGNITNHRLGISEQKKRYTTSPSENNMRESSSLSDQKMRE